MVNALLNEKTQALKNAVVSVEMEGYKISEEEKKRCMDVLNGIISKDDFKKNCLKGVYCNVILT